MPRDPRHRRHRPGVGRRQTHLHQPRGGDRLERRGHSTFCMPGCPGHPEDRPGAHIVPTTPSFHEPRSPERMTRIPVVRRTKCPSDPPSHLSAQGGLRRGGRRDRPGCPDRVRCQWCGSALLDLMPGPSRRTLSCPARALPTPVIILTARTARSTKVVGLGVGRRRLRDQAPLVARELLARIKAVLRRLSGPRNCCRPRSRRARSGWTSNGMSSAWGNQISLPLQGVRAARDAVAQPGRVLTRIQLIDRVGLGLCQGTPRTLDVHVKRLQSQDRARPNPRHIVTVRGLGYPVRGSDRGPGGRVNTLSEARFFRNSSHSGPRVPVVAG